MPTPRDAQGNVVPHNDPEILDNDRLIRLVNPTHHVVWDANQQVHRISSALFNPSSSNAGVSVEIEPLLVADGISIATRVPSGWGAVSLNAGDARVINLDVGKHPLSGNQPGAPNPYHGEIWGVRSRASKRHLVEKAIWIVNY